MNPFNMVWFFCCGSAMTHLTDEDPDEPEPTGDERHREIDEEVEEAVVATVGHVVLLK